MHFENKYVRTEAFMKEQAAGKMLYRGAFSVGNPSGGKIFNPFNFSVKGIANTGVLYWGGKLLALYEVTSLMFTAVRDATMTYCLQLSLGTAASILSVSV